MYWTVDSDDYELYGGYDKKLKLKLDLVSIAASSTVISLWEMPDVQQKIQNYFSKPSESTWTKRSGWRKIENAVYDDVNKLDKPQTMIMKLRSLVDLIGDKIFNWYQYIMLDLGLPCTFGKKIYWTSYGRIDESRIFQEFWQYEPNFSSSNERVNFLGSSLFMVACIFAQEDYIKNHFQRMVPAITLNLGLHQAYTIPTIVTNLLKKYLGIPLDSALTELLIKGSAAGFCRATIQFIINTFDSDFPIRFRNIAEASLQDSATVSNRYKQDNIADTLLFYFNKMALNAKCQFFRSDQDPHSSRYAWYSEYIFLALLLQVWQYQPLILEIISCEQIKTDLFNRERRSLLAYMTKIFKSRPSFTPSLYKNTDEIIFIEILKIMPTDIKSDELSRDWDSYILSDLFEVKYYDVLRYAIHDDEDLSNLKDDIVSGGNQCLRNIIKRHFHQIEDVMNELLLVDTAKKMLKNKYCSTLLGDQILFPHLQNEDFRYIDDLLIWLSESESERINLKKQINSTNYCLIVLRHSLRTESSERKKCCESALGKINRYLNWQFDTEQERADFKNNLDLIKIYQNLITMTITFESSLLDDIICWQVVVRDERKVKEIKLKIVKEEYFLYEQFGRLWFWNFLHRGEEGAKDECTKYFIYFFESYPEMITKKKKAIANKHQATFKTLYSCCRNYSNEKMQDLLEKLLKFCNVTTDKLYELRQEIYPDLSIQSKFLQKP